MRSKRLRVVAGGEKGAPWSKQDVKEAIRAKKGAFKNLFQNRSTSDLKSKYSETQNAEAPAVKISEERFRKEFGCWLDSNYSSTNKVFW